MKLLQYLIFPLSPKRMLPHIIENKQRTTIAILELLIIGVLYTLTVYVGYLNGFGAVVKPILAISPEEYYLWESFFCIPVFMTVAVVFAGFARLFAGWFGGNGTFDSLFAIYSSSIVVPMLITMWIPETLLMIGFPDSRALPLGGFQLWPSWIDDLRQGVGLLWPLAITIYGIGKSERVPFRKALLIAILAFLPSGALMFILIR